MAFWCRIKQSKLKHLTHHFKRYYVQVPSLNYTTTHARICVVEKPALGIVRRPTDFCNIVRFFAAPVQFQSKKDDKDTNGPRLNDQITAQFIRLVTEGGHDVVSRHEALERARKLQLDLVEVDRNAKPPVCKIMDFHREKYKKEVQVKDRAKSKSEVSLRKGDCKEVRFSGKIEQKDLQMKADTVKRLMERGYRVKCMALPVSKKEHEEDLGGYLSRLITLIEDVSVIESGPRVEKKQAYAIIRHVKFGPSKKGGGAKKSKVVGDKSDVASKDATSPPAVDHSETEDEMVPDEVDLPVSPPIRLQEKNIKNNKAAWPVLNSNDNFDKVFDRSNDTKGPTLNFMGEAGRNAVPGTARSPASFNASNPRAENRYKRSEPMNQFPPTKSTDNRQPGMRDSARLEPQLPNQRRQPPPIINVPTSVGERVVRADASGFRNSKLPIMPKQEPPKQEPSRPNAPSTASSSYGIFSNGTANASSRQGVAANVHRNMEGSPLDSSKSRSTTVGGSNDNIPNPGSKSGGSQKPGEDNEGQKKYGVFGR